MGIFDKLKGGKKDKVFEDELMDTQSELIALTLNIDDSCLKNQQYYPYDLAHFKK